MKIAIAAKTLSEKNFGGIGHFTHTLCSSFAQKKGSHEIHLYSPHPFLHKPQGDNVTLHVNGPSIAYSSFGFPLQIRNKGFDFAFLPKEGGSPLFSLPVVIFVHDLYFLTGPRRFRKKHTLLFPTYFKWARKILTNSEDTKKEILPFCRGQEDKIVVTPLGYNASLFYPRASEECAAILKKYSIEAPYFLNTSSYWWERKNLLRLIESFSLFLAKNKGEYQLIITGNRGSLYESMLRLIAEKNLEKRVKLLDYVQTEDLPALFSRAEALVFPSLHEGFGLPIVEAMSTGCPIITSNVSALPEVAGEAGLLVNPLSIDEIAEAMQQILDPKIKKEKIEQGFRRAPFYTNEMAADRILKVFENF